MPKNNRSFFERLTGSVNADDINEAEERGEEFADGEEEEKNNDFQKDNKPERVKPAKTTWMEDEEEEGQLAVDMFQTPAEIIIQAVVAGTKPDELDVSITQDMVTLRGKRQKQREVSGENYYYQELYWGTFSRSILLPQEVDSESAEATMKNGLLTIKLPKLDKNRIQKVRVKNE